MIIPCMNSTSACDRGGSVPFVDAGSVLLGCPGAPGCTTTAFAGSVCAARPCETKKAVHAQAAINIPHSITRLRLSVRFDGWLTAVSALPFCFDGEPSRAK
jgi:hypothetical protein